MMKSSFISFNFFFLNPYKLIVFTLTNLLGDFSERKQVGGKGPWKCNQMRM